MYDILDLNNKKVGELKDIAEKLNLTKFDKLKKQELVYKILDEQAINPPKEEKRETVKADKKPAHKRPTNKKPESKVDKHKTEEKPKETQVKNSPSKEEAVVEISESMAKRDDPSRPNPVSRPGDKNGRNKQNNPKRNENRPSRKDPAVEHGYNFDGIVISEGVLEIMPDGYGFLRSSDYHYLSSPDDVYVSQSQIKLFGLKTGDTIRGGVRPPKEGERYFPLINVEKINGRTPEFIRDRVPFQYLTPLFPSEKFKLTGHSKESISTRIMDLFAPIGKGQRGMIVAQPKTGKTCVIKGCCKCNCRKPS